MWRRSANKLFFNRNIIRQCYRTLSFQKNFICSTQRGIFEIVQSFTGKHGVIFGGRHLSIATEEAMAWLESLEDGNLDLSNLQFTRQKLERTVLLGEEGENWQVQRLTLACLAAAGIGGEQDILLAERCLLSVAESGNVEAMFRLAELYLYKPKERTPDDLDFWTTFADDVPDNSNPRSVDPTLARAVR